MRIKTHILLFLLLSPAILQAQEHLRELYFEPAQFNRALRSNSAIRSGETYYFIGDTLVLPFFDDFTRDRTRRYDYPWAFISKNIFGGGACCLQDSANLDSIILMYDTSWTYTFSTSDSTLDSSAKSQVGILLFEDTSNCLSPTAVIWLWPAYYKYTFDTLTGNPVDSVQVLPDTVIYISGSLKVVEPDPFALWEDNDVFVNRTYPVNPPSIGAATFNGLNELGLPYNWNSLSYGGADTLTSKPIDLGGMVASDSLYLSFFYQPQGVGDMPDAGDSILLELRRVDSTWTTAWTGKGDTVEKFRRVLIPLIDPDYFYNGFRFRFRNYATLSGNNDHWHLDYVYLDAGRSNYDTILSDIAFTDVPLQILKTFTAIPWNHFDTSDLVDTLSVTMMNHYNDTISVNYRYRAIEAMQGLFINTEQKSTNIWPLSDTTGFFSTVPIILTSTNDSVIAEITWTVEGGDVFPKTTNDSVILQYPMFNYFAYDDGSAEKAYYLKGTGAKLAYRFTIDQPDTLQGVMMHWAHLNTDASTKLFSLVVWNSISGLPGTELYKKDFQKPVYDDSLNGFWLYTLDQPIILPAGTFFIGWIQTANELLNIGYDVNENAKDYIYYDVGLGWKKTSFNGALMIRPVVGAGLIAGITTPRNLTGPYVVSPNPAENIIIIRSQDAIADYTFGLFDLPGRQIMAGNGTDGRLDVSSILPGIYFLKISPPKGPASVHKIIKVR